MRDLSPRDLSPRNLILLAGLGSASLLAGAFAFQYIGGLFPCTLCLWQRWPHAAAVLLMLVALIWRPSTGIAVLGAIAALATAGIGVFHVGVEQGWWEGLASCTGGSLTGMNVNDLLNPNADIAKPVRCDDIAWSMFGISMAGWNVILSLGLAVIWGLAAVKASTRS